jgi:hypothetical protein
MKMWLFPAGGTTRYVVAAHLAAHSSISLVEPCGFSAIRWSTHERAEIVRGRWISTSPDLRLVLDGNALPLDLAAEERLLEGLCQKWGVPIQQRRATPAANTNTAA